MLFSRVITSVLLAGLSAPAFTASGMPDVLKDYGSPVSCHDALINSASALIGKNESRLYIDPQTAKTETPVINGVIFFHDRNAAVSLHPIITADKQCKVAVHETFVTSDPCLTIRDEIFRKWELTGKLSDNTSLYRKSKSSYYQMAYLTNAMKNNPSCMATIYRELDSNVTPKDLNLK